jgi:mannan polymerase II complex MNN11 subunit
MPTYRRKQLKSVAVLAFAILALLYIVHHLYSTSSFVVASASTSGVVIVTLLDRHRFSESYVKKIVANREDYAKRHGKDFGYSLPEFESDLISLVNRLYKLLRECVRL